MCTHITHALLPVTVLHAAECGTFVQSTDLITHACVALARLRDTVVNESAHPQGADLPAKGCSFI